MHVIPSIKNLNDLGPYLGLSVFKLLLELLEGSVNYSISQKEEVVGSSGLGLAILRNIEEVVLQRSKA